MQFPSSITVLHTAPENWLGKIGEPTKVMVDHGLEASLGRGKWLKPESCLSGSLESTVSITTVTDGEAATLSKICR